MKHFATTFVIASLIGAVSASADNITLLGTQDLDWQPTPEGVAFAALQGNRFEEAYQAMVELPAGTVSPPHVKSANMYGIALGGQMAHYPSGDDPAAAPSIGPGGFYYIPAGLEHVSACVSAEPCVAYLYQDGAFDFLVAQRWNGTNRLASGLWLIRHAAISCNC